MLLVGYFANAVYGNSDGYGIYSLLHSLWFVLI